MENQEVKKRIIIIFGFIVFFSLIGLVLYYLITPPPTCSDKKQNQAEKGIDCGGPCSPCKDIIGTQDIIIRETAVVFGGNDTYDAVAKITNPNNSLGVSLLKYEVNLKDEAGNVVATRQGNNFVLPGDSKHILEFGLKTENAAVPVAAEFVIFDVKWEKLNNISKPQIGIYSKNFGKSPIGIGSEADGIIRNESDYSLNEIFISVILHNEEGKIVGINQTKKSLVRIKEERDFKLTWPYELPSEVQSMEIDAQANVYDSSNFSFTVQ